MMTRDEAFALAARLIDAGHSCTVDCGVYPKMAPRENYAVAVHALRFDSVKIRDLLAIADETGTEMHLLDNALRFLPAARGSGIDGGTP